MSAKNWAQTRRARRGATTDAGRARGLCRRLMHAGDLKGAATAALLAERLERLERAAQKRAAASPRPQPPPPPAPPPPPMPPPAAAAPPPNPVAEEPVVVADRSGCEPRDWQKNIAWR